MQKNYAVYLLFFGLFLGNFDAFSQKALSLSFGFPSINWDYEGNFDALRTVNTGGWSITASGLKTKENGLIYGVDLGVNRYGNGFQYEYSRPGIGEIHHFSILPLIGYNHTPTGSKFSIRLNFAFGIGVVGSDNRYYENDKSFQVRYTSYGVPLHDLTFSGSQEVKSRVFPLLKPNVELHYAVGERSTLFLKGVLGISLVKDVIVRDFQKVVFEAEEYQVTHSTSMSFWAFELGYSMKLRK